MINSCPTCTIAQSGVDDSTAPSFTYSDMQRVRQTIWYNSTTPFTITLFDCGKIHKGSG